MSEKIRLTGVPKTMLQTVYARAKESRGRGVIRDRKAEEAVDRPDYDFSLADRDSIMHSGVITRTVLLDRLVGDWLKRNPGAAVVNIACGRIQADVRRIFSVIAGRFPKVTVFVETMNPTVVKHVKEKTIVGSLAKFSWGMKNGRALEKLLPEFRLTEEHSLTGSKNSVCAEYFKPD